MNAILEGVKPASVQKTTQTITRFIIKSKPSLKQNKLPIQIEPIVATSEDVDQFITYMITKSTRLHQFVELSKIDDFSIFSGKHLFGSVSMRMLLKSILQKMLIERRLGKNLKGINKSLFEEIQNSIWHCIQRQQQLYQLQKQYSQAKQNLSNDIKNRKQVLLRQLNDQEQIINQQVSEDSHSQEQLKNDF